MKNLLQIFTLCIFFLPVCVQAQGFGVKAVSDRDAAIRDLSRSKEWLRLLHYKSHTFSGFESALDGEGFFLGVNGREDPEAEMRGTIAAFTERRPGLGTLKVEAACAFPARFRFLRERLGYDWKQPVCEKFQEFLAKFHEPQSATLVFSSAYPNNPASMFGHTFLRINGAIKKHDILDYGINYAAQVPDDENPFLFAFFGLAGGYLGRFSLAPYYAKVAEYNNSESRDIWEYDLNLTRDQTWYLLANAWEIEVNSHLDYYFFDENCAYQILTLLEVARPDWDLSSYFIHMIPGESVKRVMDVPGAVTAIRYRPSLFKKMLARGERLNAEERKQYFQLIKGEGAAAATTPALAAAAEYYLYLKQKDSGLTETQKKEFQALLTERSTRKDFVPDPEIDGSASRPDFGHHANRLGYGAGIRKGDHSYGAFHELTIRFPYHDLLANDVGYVPYSEIHFPNFSFRYFPEERRFYLSRAELFSIYSLSAWNWMKKSLSWKARSAFEVPNDLCSSCRTWHGEMGVGLSQSASMDRVRFYQLFGAFADVGGALPEFWRVGPELSVGLLVTLGKWKQHWEARAAWDPVTKQSGGVFARMKVGQAFHFSRAIETRLELQRVAKKHAAKNEGLVSFFYHY